MMQYEVYCTVYADGRNGAGQLVVTSDNVPLSKEDIAEIEADKETFAMKIAAETYEHLKSRCPGIIFNDLVNQLAQKILAADDIRIRVVNFRQIN
jgi:hypothetical protein